MDQRMNAADVMTPDPVTVRPETNLADVVHLMLGRRISGVPVVGDGGELVGIVTEGDLLRRAETATDQRRRGWLEFLTGPGPLAADYVHTHSRNVADLMTRDVVAVEPETPLADVVRLMQRKHVKRLPVTSAGRCVGIISRADLMRALGKVLDQTEHAWLGDDDIREHIRREFENSPWGKNTRIEVSVDDGVVDLEGVVFDDRAREAFRVAAENTPGVKQVRDRITWVDPNTGVTLIPGGEATGL